METMVENNAEVLAGGSVVVGRKLKTTCPKKGAQTQFATVDCFINGVSQAISDRTAPHGTSLVPCDLRSLGGGPRDLKRSPSLVP